MCNTYQHTSDISAYFVFIPQCSTYFLINLYFILSYWRMYLISFFVVCWFNFILFSSQDFRSHLKVASNSLPLQRLIFLVRHAFLMTLGLVNYMWWMLSNWCPIYAIILFSWCPFDSMLFHCAIMSFLLMLCLFFFLKSVFLFSGLVFFSANCVRP